MRSSRRIDDCIERLCQKGCAQVWGDIDALERGESLPETEGLSDGERQRVLRELKAVMRVYKDRCRLD
ncbi:MAG: hypothetical protein D6720_09950 [Gammaproteobacteria bacterium]|nr:MAG: hypothetical protein D6720_09950 [Gammaproteobacteria bacterium]